MGLFAPIYSRPTEMAADPYRFEDVGVFAYNDRVSVKFSFRAPRLRLGNEIF